MNTGSAVRSRGLTLVELMVVVALIGILTSIAASAIGPLATRYRVRQGTETAAHALARAQTQVRATGRCHRLEASVLDVAVAAGTEGSSLLLSSLDSADCETGTAWTTLETFALPNGVTAMVDLGAGPNPIFRPNGRSRAAAGALLRVSPTGIDSRIRVSASGAICITDLGACP